MTTYLRFLTRTAPALGLLGIFALSTLLLAEPELRERYKLRPGDVLDLQYRLTPDLNQTVIVQPDGFVSVNVAGEVKVEGLSVYQAHDLIVREESVRLNQPELNLVLKDFTRPAVVVSGEVYKPMIVELKQSTTALGAVLIAGGFTESAQSGQVLVYRRVNDQMAEVRTLNLTKIRTTADMERDLTLQPGDMIYVPRDKIAKIKRYINIVNTGVFFNPLQTLQ